MKHQHIKISSLIFVLSFCSLLFLITEVQSAKTTTNVSYLFVQTTDQGSFDGQKIILKGVSPQTVFFSDRPNRIAGHLKTSKFIKDWSKGKNSFKKDPPNVNISLLKGKKIENIVVNVSSPVLNGDTLTYDAKILMGKLPASFDAASLFFDIVMTGGGPGSSATHFSFELSNIAQ